MAELEENVKTTEVTENEPDSHTTAYEEEKLDIKRNLTEEDQRNSQDGPMSLTVEELNQDQAKLQKENTLEQDLTENGVKEEEITIDMVEKNGSQSEKDEKPDENNIKKDEMIKREFEKKKSHVEDGNQDQSESEKLKECLEPCIKINERDEKDEDKVKEHQEKSHKQDKDTKGPEENKNELTGNTLAECETNIKLLDKNACQGEKNDESEVNNIKEDGPNVEFETKKSHVEDGNQNQSEAEKPKECLEPCLSNEERDERGEDQVEKPIEKSHEQNQDTREPEGNKNDLTGNSLAEGETNIKLLDNNAGQGEKNDESEVNNIKEDGTDVEFEKKKSQDEKEKTRKLRQQSSEVKKDSIEDGEINTMPEEKETRQNRNDNDQEEKSTTRWIKLPSWRVRYFTFQTGNTRDSHKKFLKTLHKKNFRLKQADKARSGKFCLVFCPVVSRAGTDIEAALHQLKEISDTKPAILVVLHHTIDQECIVPDSSRAVQRENMIAVDCVFHEDHGLYKCSKNKEAVKKVAKWLKTKPWRNVVVKVR
ncbi:uncharacterized protein Hap1MRO34_026204 [Clarias gariepinus]